MPLDNICPRSAIIFAAQIITVLVIVITGAIKLTLGTENSPVWIVLLSSAVGFILPTPGLKRKKCNDGDLSQGNIYRPTTSS